MKPNTTEFPFLYHYGRHLRKGRKIKARNLYVKINLKARNQITSSPFEEVLLRPKKDESDKSNLFRDQSYFNCVSSDHFISFLVCLVVTE